MSTTKKGALWFPIIIGAILISVGLFIQMPGGALTTYRSLNGQAADSSYYNFDNRYSTIDEYVGGDAYNFIIGASLVAGKISGTMTVKALCIVGGTLCICFGVTLMMLLPERSPMEELLNEINHTLRIGYADDLTKEEAERKRQEEEAEQKRREEEAERKRQEEEAERVRIAQAEREQQQQEEAELKKQEEQRKAAESSSKIARVSAYWDQHPEELRILAEKRAELKERLRKPNLSQDEQTSLENQIKEIDRELDREA